jgi:uncharacterized protein YkwD
MRRPLVLALTALATLTAPAMGSVIISEIAVEGEDFVELVNTGPNDASLANSRLRFFSAGCSPSGADLVLPDVSLVPGQRYLAGLPEKSDSPTGGTELLPAGGGAVHLVSGETTTDRVAWGDHYFCGEGEGMLPSPAAGSSLERGDGGTRDTDDNVADFSVRTPANPQNMAESTPTPEATPEPTVVVTATATATATAAPTTEPTVTPPITDILKPVEINTPQISGPTVSPPRPQAGKPAILRFSLSDPDQPVNGAWIQTDEPGGLVGLSSCRPADSFPAGSSAVIAIPITFGTPGRHTITIHAGSGQCLAGGQTVIRTITVDVLEGKALASAASARASAAGCAGATTRMNGRNRAKIAKALLCAINAERKRNGVKPVRASAALSRFATAHTTDMVASRFYSHDSPTKGGFAARLRRSRYRGSSGENLGAGMPTVAGIMKGWMGSPIHRANVLSKRWKFVGISVLDRNPIGRPKPGATWSTVYGSSRG